jgi:hypothetical protein
VLNALDTAQATELLLTGIRKTSSNAEFLKWVQRELSKEPKYPRPTRTREAGSMSGDEVQVHPVGVFEQPAESEEEIKPPLLLLRDDLGREARIPIGSCEGLAIQFVLVQQDAGIASERLDRRALLGAEDGAVNAAAEGEQAGQAPAHDQGHDEVQAVLLEGLPQRRGNALYRAPGPRDGHRIPFVQGHQPLLSFKIGHYERAVF